MAPRFRPACRASRVRTSADARRASQPGVKTPAKPGVTMVSHGASIFALAGSHAVLMRHHRLRGAQEDDAEMPDASPAALTEVQKYERAIHIMATPAENARCGAAAARPEARTAERSSSYVMEITDGTDASRPSFGTLRHHRPEKRRSVPQNKKR